MKNLPLIIVSALLAFSFSSYSQCTIDFSQTQPGIYPDTLPDGMVGQPYSEDITFVMPTDTSGFNFTNFYIQAVSGLPFGLNWVCNAQGNGCNYDPQSNIYGCMNVSGTPIQPGVYPLTVNVIATLQILGDVPATFDTQVTILADTSSNSGFSVSGGFGCTPLVTTFTNLNPGYLAYNWDFGNGSTSTQENPSPQIYSTPGDYIVTYEAYADTVPAYYLTEVQVLGIPNNWGWPGDLNPDMYIEIYDGSMNLVYTSATIQDTDPPVTYAIPNLLLADELYTVNVWDEDGGLFGADDDLGITYFQGWGPSGSSTTGSTSISYTIQAVGPFPVVSSSDTVNVFGFPNAPNIDSNGLLLWTDSISLTLQWYQNGNAVPGADSASYLATTSGDYFVISTSPSGCYASSDTISITICDSLFNPMITQNGHLLFTDTSSYDFQWYYNGNPISGATGQLITADNEGDYWVELTAYDGCVYTSAVQTVDFTSLLDLGDDLTFSMGPNPSSGEFTIHLSEGVTDHFTITILDITGRMVYQQIEHSNETNIDLSNQEAGTYFVRITVGDKSATKTLILK
jgi:hypothetical protein